MEQMQKMVGMKTQINQQTLWMLRLEFIQKKFSSAVSDADSTTEDADPIMEEADLMSMSVPDPAFMILTTITQRNHLAITRFGLHMIMMMACHVIMQ
ncbi:hypothetical protein SLE2022_395910 [Rubroshorea leprosula]